MLDAIKHDTNLFVKFTLSGGGGLIRNITFGT